MLYLFLKCEGKQTWLQVLAIDNNSSVCHHKYKSELTGGNTMLYNEPHNIT